MQIFSLSNVAQTNPLTKTFKKLHAYPNAGKVTRMRKNQLKLNQSQ